MERARARHVVGARARGPVGGGPAHRDRRAVRGQELHREAGRLALAVTQSLLAGNAAEPAALLERLAADPAAARLLPFVRALQAVVAGSRDRSLAEAPELDPTMAAEILFLIETLERGSGTDG